MAILECTAEKEAVESILDRAGFTVYCEALARSEFGSVLNDKPVKETEKMSWACCAISIRLCSPPERRVGATVEPLSRRFESGSEGLIYGRGWRRDSRLRWASPMTYRLQVREFVRGNLSLVGRIVHCRPDGGASQQSIHYGPACMYAWDFEGQRGGGYSLDLTVTG